MCPARLDDADGLPPFKEENAAGREQAPRRAGSDYAPHAKHILNHYITAHIRYQSHILRRERIKKHKETAKSPAVESHCEVESPQSAPRASSPRKNSSTKRAGQ